MPSRSGVFLVDQTVPTTFPRNISFKFQVPSFKFKAKGVLNLKLETWNLKLAFSEDLRRFAYVAGCRSDNGLRVDIDLLAFLNGASDVVFTHEVDCPVAVCGMSAAPHVGLRRSARSFGVGGSSAIPRWP